MNFNETHFQYLKSVWNRNNYYFSPPMNHIDYWIDYISNRNDEKDIKKIKQSLDYLFNEGFLIKEIFLKSLQKNTNQHTFVIPFSFCTIFDYLKFNHLLTEEEISLNSLLTGTDLFIKSYCKKKYRFHSEQQINLLLSFDVNEERLNKVLDLYGQIRGTYTLDLSEQKKLLKIFNSYAGDFIKSLSNDKQRVIFQKLDTLCSGINNKTHNEIEFQIKEEFSFRFVISISNALKDHYAIFNNMKSIIEVVLEKIKEIDFTEILFKEINSQSSIGPLQFQYAFFSPDKACIEKYSTYFQEFNAILTQDALNKNLNNDHYYVDLFQKICLKKKLSDNLEPKNTTTKSVKI